MSDVLQSDFEADIEENLKVNFEKEEKVELSDLFSMHIRFNCVLLCKNIIETKVIKTKVKLSCSLVSDRFSATKTVQTAPKSLGSFRHFGKVFKTA